MCHLWGGGGLGLLLVVVRSLRFRIHSLCGFSSCAIFRGGGPKLTWNRNSGGLESLWSLKGGLMLGPMPRKQCVRQTSDTPPLHGSRV